MNPRLLANPLAKELLTYLKLPDYAKHLGTIPEMRKNIQALCGLRLNWFLRYEKRPKRLLFVVDDLDRCDTKNIVKVFEAVRLVLEIPQVVVIIAIDQRIALSALALHYKELANYHPSQSAITIARDYLSKIIHLPITLSEPDEESVSAYLKHLWKEEEADDVKDTTSSDVNTQREPFLGDTNKSVNSGPGSSSNDNASSVNAASSDVSEIAEQVNNSAKGLKDSTVEAAPEPVPIVGLSPEQKEAFTYWVNYFGLVNPRQLKRLDNSYKLLRNYYEVDQSPVVISDTDSEHSVHIFPVMITLFALEYCNNLQDVAQRLQVKHYLSADSTVPRKIKANTELGANIDAESEDKDDLIITPAIARVTSKSLENRKVSLMTAVEPFVLPAIDVNIHTLKKNTTSCFRGEDKV